MFIEALGPNHWIPSKASCRNRFHGDRLHCVSLGSCVIEKRSGAQQHRQAVATIVMNADSLNEAPLFQYKLEVNVLELVYHFFFVANSATATITNEIVDTGGKNPRSPSGRRGD